jgi:hypothetical protein
MDPKFDADDLLWGVEAIAKAIQQSRRMTYWRLENGQLPAGKIGSVWVASRQQLQKFFQELTAKTPAPAKCIASPRTVRPRRKAGIRTGVKRAASA